MNTPHPHENEMKPRPQPAANSEGHPGVCLICPTLLTQNAPDAGGRYPILCEPHNEPILRFFRFSHLTSAVLQETSRPFLELAKVIMTLPRNAERSAALRKLLEAKDCAVRAAVTS